MEREARYAAVGAFVLLVLAMAVLFVYWYDGSPRAARLHALRDLLRRQRERPCARRAGALSRRRRRPRGAHAASIRATRAASRSSSTSTRAHRCRRTTLAELSLQGVTGLLYIDLIVNAAGTADHRGGAEPRISGDPLGALKLRCVPCQPSWPREHRGRRRRARRAHLLRSEHHRASATRSATSTRRARNCRRRCARSRSLTADLRGATAEIERRRRERAHGHRRRADRSCWPRCSTCAWSPTISPTPAASSMQLVQDNREDVRVFARDGLPELERLLRDGARRGGGISRPVALAARKPVATFLPAAKSEAVEIPP